MRFPSWLIIVFALFWIGPAMRWMFGGWHGSSARRIKDLAGRDLSTRIDTALSERDTVLEDLQRRISELESRLDFTERLLAERREPVELR